MSILDQEPIARVNASFWDGSPKTMFFMGLFLGLAVSASLALVVLVRMISRGQVLAGSNPAAVAAVPQVPVGDDQAVDASPTKPMNPVDDKVDHILGNRGAKVTLVEYSDFQCPYCQRFAPTVRQALKDFPQDIRLVYRHFPLSSIHPQAQKAAEASECVAKLGGNDKFWQMHDKLFVKQDQLGEQVFTELAKEVGVNEQAFKNCLSSGEMANRVQSDFSSGNDSGVRGTPSSFINGQPVSPTGAIGYAELRRKLEAAGAKK